MKKNRRFWEEPVRLTGMIMALGIVFTDLGTSPLYVMRAVQAGMTGKPDPDFIIGVLSCIIWALTLQTTLRYVVVTLRADNQGEGGILSLYARIRKSRKSLSLAAIIGAAALLAAGVAGPAVTVLAASEGLQLSFPGIPLLPVALGILAALFLVQRFGVEAIRLAAGPFMLLWFLALCSLGLPWILRMPEVMQAFNPIRAITFLIHEPRGFLLLGAILLATTGSEALFSGLGTVNRRTISISWIVVKITLIINYLGQGAWMLQQQFIPDQPVNPFFAILPSSVLPAGVFVAILAAALTGLAMTSRLHPVISEAITLNFWPKMKIKYPSARNGRVYLPSVNRLLFLLCGITILLFYDSTRLDAAYLLACSIAMLITAILLTARIATHIRLKILRVLFIAFCILIDGAGILAALTHFTDGSWFALLLAGGVFLLMLTWFKARQIRNQYTRFVKLDDHARILEDLSRDRSVPKYATNLVYLTRANSSGDIETKIIQSICRKNPKRADTYWLLHIDFCDDPHTREYSVEQLIPGVLIRMEFRLGYKVRPRINLLFNQVVKEMSCNNEIDFLSRYPSLRNHDVQADFRFIVIHRILNHDYVFPRKEQMILDLYAFLARLALPDAKFYGLDECNATTEEVLLISAIDDAQLLKRIFPAESNGSDR